MPAIAPKRAVVDPRAILSPNCHRSKTSAPPVFRVPLAVASGLFVLLGLSQVVADTPKLEVTTLFEEGQDGFVSYRIPGIVVTKTGTVLAYCEARKYSGADWGELEIHLRRSEDGGRTWSPAVQVAHRGPRLSRNPYMIKEYKKAMGGPDEQTVNNAVAIAARDGTIHLIYCVEYQRSFAIHSRDDGRSWSMPIEITAAFDDYRKVIDWHFIGTGPGHAIEGASGRLIVPFWMKTTHEEANPRNGVGIVYSDDGGQSWKGGSLVMPDAGEPNIAATPDGRFLITARNSASESRRKVSYSRDGVHAWTPATFNPDLLEPGCMAGLVAHPGTIATNAPFLLFSNPHTIQRSHKERRNVTIKLSYDNGQSWPVSKLLYDGPSAYSDLAVLPNGEILCFFECGDEADEREHGRPWAYGRLDVARFNLDWLSAPTAPVAR